MFLADAPPLGSFLLLGRRESMFFHSIFLRELCSSFLPTREASSIKVHVSCKDRSIYMNNTWDWNYETDMYPLVDVRTCVM